MRLADSAEQWPLADEPGLADAEVDNNSSALAATFIGCYTVTMMSGLSSSASGHAAQDTLADDDL